MLYYASRGGVFIGRQASGTPPAHTLAPRRRLSYQASHGRAIVGKRVPTGASTARSATASLGAAVRATRTSVASLSAAVRIARTATASMTAAVQQGRSTGSQVGLAAQVGRSAVASLAAFLSASGGTLVYASLEVARQRSRVASASLSVMVQDSGAVVPLRATPRSIRLHRRRRGIGHTLSEE